MRNIKLLKKARILKALGHPVRLSIICKLYDSKQNVTQLCDCLEVSQPVVSQHLALMRSIGLIEGKRSGAKVIYKIKNPFVRDIIQLVIDH
ncbi:HTH-type transcriptional repressor SmtB [bacterium BMS3Abin05]|nr:HTH-type transcriptional repressor SmtB [bacterium BMS3Abin05]GBE28675.1 HTH-type transcriptional repressor SmtB [bacterium BMS3Bbin03]